MSFNWTIPNWIRMMLPPHLGKPKMEAWLNILLTPVETTKTKYITETKVNGQTMVLEAFLNDTFDSALRRIYITSLSDILPGNYIYLSPEGQLPKYIYTTAENTQETWLYRTIQYGDNSGFKVQIPLELESKTGTILLYVNKYKLAGKAVIIELY